MTFQERLSKLDQLHHLIRRRATGSPVELAQRMQLCERTVYKMLDDLRNMGAPIAYCRNRCSYYYEREVRFNFTPVFLNENAEKVKGGRKIIPFFATARMVQGLDVAL
jgi:predicted DNA-binding transcriptional regulator YafY